jgi:hypothetical protein
MTIQRLVRSEQQIRWVVYPLLTWLFTVLAIYNMVAIVLGVIDGRQPFNNGTLIALSLILGVTLFVNFMAGEFAVCTFDKAAQQIRLRRYSLRGIARFDRPLPELTAIKVVQMRGAYCAISLNLRSGEQLPLVSSYVILLSLRNVTELVEALGVTLEAKKVDRNP